MRVVTWSGVTDGTSASAKQIAQVVRQDLELVGSEAAVVPQKMVVGRTAGPLDPVVRHQEEVVFSRMDDVGVHHCSRRNVPGFAHLQVYK